MPHWLLEGILIVVSVALGFALAQLGEYRSDREFARKATASIEAEIAHNRRILEAVVPVHLAWTDALRTVDLSDDRQSALDVFFATRPELPAESATPFPYLRRSAWDAAVAGGALRLVDYDLAGALSEIYLLQEIARANVDRLANGALSSPATFDPATRRAAVQLLWLTLADIAGAEALLLDRYRGAMPDMGGAAR